MHALRDVVTQRARAERPFRAIGVEEDAAKYARVLGALVERDWSAHLVAVGGSEQGVARTEIDRVNFRDERRWHALLFESSSPPDGSQEQIGQQLVCGEGRVVGKIGHASSSKDIFVQR